MKLFYLRIIFLILFLIGIPLFISEEFIQQNLLTIFFIGFIVSLVIKIFIDFLLKQVYTHISKLKSLHVLYNPQGVSYLRLYTGTFFGFGLNKLFNELFSGDLKLDASMKRIQTTFRILVIIIEAIKFSIISCLYVYFF